MAMNTAERNKKKHLPCRWQWLVAALLLVLVSCDGHDAVTSAPLEVSAGIAGVHTRAEGDKNAGNYEKKGNFETGDLITIRKKTDSESAAVPYVKGTDGWVPEVSTKQILTTGNEVFFASYPSEFNSILSDQSTYTNFWKSNRLTSTATATANRVKFEFSPAAAKITIVVIYEADNSAVEAKVAGAGVCTESGKTGNLQLLLTSDEPKRHTYTGIISTGTSFPYTITVVTSVGGKQETKSYEEVGGNGFTLQAGYEYQYTFTTTSELILSSVVVKEFLSGGTQDVGSAT